MTTTNRSNSRTPAAVDGSRLDVIIAAAAKLFHERGYSGTTVRDLAGEVGISSGSVFHHFKSKEEVLLRVVEQGLADATERIASTDSGDTPVQNLRAMIRAHVGLLVEGSPAALSVLFHERYSLSDEGRERLIALRDEYERKWDVALKQLGGRYANASHRRLTRLLLLGSMNWVAQWYTPTGAYDLDEITDELVDRYARDTTEPREA